MCYGVSTPSKVKLNDFLHGHVTIERYERSYHLNGFARPALPVITNEEPGLLQAMLWGLVPFWAKDKNAANDIALKTLNARSETIFTLNSFRESIQHKRCLIIIDGFYEWEHQGKERVPYFIYMPDHQPFALGGIWSQWVDKETGEVLETCSIITTPANELMAKIHNVKKRMPLILDESVWQQWLAQGTSQQELEQIMKPYPDGQLQAHRISKLVSSRTADSNVPEVQDPAMETLF